MVKGSLSKFVSFPGPSMCWLTCEGFMVARGGFIGYLVFGHVCLALMRVPAHFGKCWPKECRCACVIWCWESSGTVGRVLQLGLCHHQGQPFSVHSFSSVLLG